MKRVVLVDDEETLVWSLVRQGKALRPDLVFEGYTDPEAARAAIGQSPPDVLITDLRMPKLNGIDLLVAARRVAPDLPVIIVTAYGTPEVRADVRQRSGVQFIDKPVSFEALLKAVDHALAPPTGFSGAIELPLLPDLIQIYAIGQTTGMLHIQRGVERGEIYFDEGQITHSECGSLRGDAAFYRVMGWEGGLFGMKNGVKAPERTIHVGWQELLMEGCRLLDEARASDPGAALDDLILGDGGAPLGTPGDLPADVGAQVDALWAVLGPEVTRAAPAASVIAVSLCADAGRVLHGSMGAGGWPPLVVGITAVVGRLAGVTGFGSVECVSPEWGVLVAWDTRSNLALAILEPFSGPSSVSRFRSNIGRWQGAYRPWLTNQ